MATSRARCVAAVVCSPALLRVGCHSPRQMQLANGLCLAVEAAEPEKGADEQKTGQDPAGPGAVESSGAPWVEPVGREAQGALV